MGFLQIHTPSYIFIPLTKKMGYEFVSCQSLGYEFVSSHSLGYENVRYHQHPYTCKSLEGYFEVFQATYPNCFEISQHNVHNLRYSYLKWGTDAGHGRKAEWVKAVAPWATPFNGKGYEQGHGPPM